MGGDFGSVATRGVTVQQKSGFANDLCLKVALRFTLSKYGKGTKIQSAFLLGQQGTFLMA